MLNHSHSGQGPISIRDIILVFLLSFSFVYYCAFFYTYHPILNFCSIHDKEMLNSCWLPKEISYYSFNIHVHLFIHIFLIFIYSRSFFMVQGVYYYFYQIFRNKAEASALERMKNGIGDGSVGMFSSLMVAALSG